MKTRSSSLFALSLAPFAAFAGALAIAACASSEEPVEEDVSDAGAPTTDAAPKPSASTTSKPDSSAPTDNCSANACTTDDDCARLCTKASSGTSCCDKGTGKCFRYTGNACPVPTPPADASTPTAPY